MTEWVLTTLTSAWNENGIWKVPCVFHGRLHPLPPTLRVHFTALFPLSDITHVPTFRASRAAKLWFQTLYASPSSRDLHGCHSQTNLTRSVLPALQVYSNSNVLPLVSTSSAFIFKSSWILNISATSDELIAPRWGSWCFYSHGCQMSTGFCSSLAAMWANAKGRQARQTCLLDVCVDSPGH